MAVGSRRRRGRRSMVNYRYMPPNSRQDNKKTRVGSGGGYERDARFPSKKRSHATWERFYKLFPWARGFKTYNEYLKNRYINAFIHKV